MPRHKGFNASVRVNKKDLEEYVVDKNDDSVTSWVVSEEGQIFDVQWQVEEPDSLYKAHLEVEGISMKSHTHTSNKSKHLWVGKRINDTEIRPFQFSRLNVTDDEPQLLRAFPNPTRSIVIRIFRLEKKTRKPKDRSEGRHRTRNTLVENSEELNRNMEFAVLEKTKNLNPHVISLSQQTRKKNTKRSRSRTDDNLYYKYLDKKDEPFFSFKIFYGPREFLQAQGVIPMDQGRGDAPPTPPSEPDATSTKLRELELRMAEVDRQQAELQREMNRLREHADSGTVKIEAKPVISFDPGEVIDLTGE